MATVAASAIEHILQDHVPHCRALGMELVDFVPPKVELGLDYRDEFVGNPETGVLHGGLITTLMHTVSGMSVYCAMD